MDIVAEETRAPASGTASVLHTRRHTAILGVALSGVALYLASRHVVWEDVRQALSHANGLLILVGFMLSILGLLLKGWRWHRIVEPVSPLSLQDATSVLFIGYLGNNVLPARLGEVVRLWFLERNYRVRLVQGLGTVVLERFMDATFILVSLSLAFFFVPIPPSVQAAGGALLATLAVAAALMFRLASGGPEAGESVQHHLPGRLGVLLGTLVGRLAEGMAVLRRRHSLLPIVAVSTAIWLNELFCCLVVMRAMGAPATPVWALFVVAVLSAGMIVPAGPGYIGSYQFIVQNALALFGVTPSLGLGVAIAMHAISYSATTLTGLLGYWRESRRLGGSNP